MPLPRARLLLTVLCLMAAATAQETPDALRLLESTAHKYQEIGSYESSAIARRALGGGLIAQVHLNFAYASARMTPQNLPLPMLAQAVQMGQFEILDEHGIPATVNRPIAGPGPAYSFDEMAWRVTSAKITGTESVHSHRCGIIEVQYEPRPINPKSEPVRYWIDPSTKTIWKMQYSEPEFGSKTGRAHWTVVWDSWIEDQPPPAWLVEFSSTDVPQEQKALIGHNAPEVTGQALSGEPFQLSGLKGNVVVLDFWGTWCGPCSLEMAFLEELKASLSGKHVEIWSITEDDPEKAKRWLAERKRTLPNAIVARNTAFRAYGIKNIPQVVIIDRKGIVAHHWAGLTSEKQLGQAIETLLVQ